MPERTITLTLSDREWERLETRIIQADMQSYGRSWTPEAVATRALLREIGDPDRKNAEAFWARCDGATPRHDTS